MNNGKPKPPYTNHISVLVNDKDALPIYGAEVVCNGRVSYTDHEGLVYFTLEAFDKPNVAIIVRKQGYKEYQGDYKNLGQGARIPITLEVVEVQWRPTDEELKNYEIRASIAHDGNRPGWKYFTGTLHTWSDETWLEWLIFAKSHNINALVFNVVVGPNVYGDFNISQDWDRIKFLLNRCYKERILPIVCIQVIDSNGAGEATVAYLPSLLREIPEIQAYFICWELEAFSEVSQYSWQSLQEVARIIGESGKAYRLLLEFAQPWDRMELVISDRREACPYSGDAEGWWKNTNARYITDILLELPHGFTEDRSLYNAFTNEVGGVFSRMSGTAFTPPYFYPNGEAISESQRADWQRFWGLSKHVNLYEYLSYHRATDEEKANLRRYIQQTIPVKEYGEG